MTYRRCCVPNCKNNAKHCSERLYTFPKNVYVFKTWVKLIDRPDIIHRHQVFICGLHFDEDEKHTLQCKLFNQDKDGKCKCQISEESIPSKHLPEKSMIKIRRLERNKRRNNRKIVNELLTSPNKSASTRIKPSFQQAEVPVLESEFVVCDVNPCSFEDDEEMQVFSESEPESFVKIEESYEEIIDPEICYLQNLCRLCAQPSVDLVPVFGEEGNNQKLQHKILMCLPIRIRENDRWPQSVCVHCISLLESSFQLNTSCQDAEKILRGLLGQQDFIQDLQERSKSDGGASVHNSYSNGDSYSASNQQIGFKMKENSDYNWPVNDTHHVSDTPEAQIQSTPASYVTQESDTQNSTKKVCKNSLKKLTYEIRKAKKAMVFSTNSFFLNETKLNEAGLFVCKLCLIDFDTLEEKKVHLAKGHTFSCLFCDFSVKALDKCALDQHFKTIHFEVNAETNFTSDNFSHIVLEHKEKLDDFTHSNIRTEIGMKHLHFLQYLQTICSVHCNSCLTKFTSEEKLKEHDCTFKNIEKIYCQTCNLQLPTKDNLKVHMRKVHCLFTCKSRQGCYEYFNTLDEANEHYKKAHKGCPQGGLCELCGRAFSKLSRLNKHVYFVHGNPENQHKCHLCPKTYRYKQKLIAHLRLHSNNEVLCRSCSHCDKKFEKPRDLNQHIIACHKDKLFHCECGKRFASKHNLYLHFKSIHLYTFNYNCSVCDKSFKYIKEVCNHYGTHSVDAMFSKKKKGQYYITSDFCCKICRQYFKMQYDLTFHVKQVHKINKSDYLSLDKDEILLHKSNFYNQYNVRSRGQHRRPQEYTSIKCPMCPKVCLNKTGYQNHIATHSTEMNFACNLCNKMFPTLSQVKAHERFHDSSEHCYICIDCGTMFGNKINLANHIQRLHVSKK